MTLRDKTLWHIEMALDRPDSLDRIAAACGVSAAHMVRSFRARTGTSPMAYARGRRLTLAAERLALGDDSILTIALDAGYGSAQAFSRAFRAGFGATPSALRASRDLSTLTLTEAIMPNTTAPSPLSAPRLETLTALHVTGLARPFTPETIGGIPALWSAFNAREDEVTALPGGASYGVCHDGDGTGRFTYLAGFGTAVTAPVPDGMTRLRVPDGRYAVFSHTGHISGLPGTVHAIWNGGLRAHGLTHRWAPDFERYDARFSGATGEGTVEIWIPVV